MKVQIKKIGCSKGVIFPKVFLKYMKLKEGDWVDIADILKVNSQGGTKK